MKRYVWLFATSVLILVAALQYRALVGFVSKLSAGRSDVEAVAVVRVAPVKKVALPFEILASGELEALREEQAVSQVSGYVEQVRVKAGDAVARGQVVATLKIREAPLRTDQIEANLREVQARLRDKEERLEDAEKQLEKLRDLRRRDLIAAKDLRDVEAGVDTARAEKELVKAQLDQQQAALAQLRYTLKLPQVIAPLGGVVTEIFVEPGGFVQNGWPILTVAASDPLKVVIKVSEKDASHLRPGSSGTVTPDDKPDRVVIGKVTGLDRSRAAKEAIVLVEIQLPNRQRQLSLGAAVSVAFQLDSNRDVLLIPRPALVEVEGQSMVYVVVNQRAHALQVSARPHRDGMIEVMQGLDESQQVVIDNPGRLKPNAKVHVDAKNSQP